MVWDLIAIGGGAAGFFGAMAHAARAADAEAPEGAAPSTLILEKSGSVLGKVKISGGGRCNVTHACLDPRDLSKNYPRGEKALLGALHRWSVADTIDWFTARGVELKTEADGRMFPRSDRSQTIVDCLTQAASDAGVEVRTGSGVKSIRRGEVFELETDRGERLEARSILLATGGTRLSASAELAEQLGHPLEAAVPSLFTFKIRDPRLDDLPGVAVAATVCKIVGSKLQAAGPLLITHVGVSGPGILRLSAWGARELASLGYRFSLRVNWLPDVDVAEELKRLREDDGKRRVHSRSPFAPLPKRLWTRLAAAAGIAPEQTWARLTKLERNALREQLCDARFDVEGKTTNKEEFVTCGGVRLRDVDMRTMESRHCEGLYFAGEVLDVDGITGGFNFQNAWTSGHLAGTSCALRREVAEQRKPPAVD